ncbi:MAG: carboxypeptidase regulatory-like domain-containing protein [Bacteroidota bacterium]|nr:MAG: carboxypeptidase regulatory-like domain-containing protein [Bacteroidota bacterium]
MNNYQESKLSMYLVVRDYMTTNATILTPLPNFAANQTAFQNAITQIQASGEQQNFDKTGIAGSKSQLKQTLVTLVADASRKLTAYAKFTNNQTLLSEVNYSESDLKRRADTNLRDAAQGIYDRAQPIVASLATYGITAATQTTLLNAINAFNTAIPKPRLGITEKKQSTSQLAALFKTADTALENIDTAVEIIRLTQVNFYNGYKAARKLVLTGGGSVSVKGIVTDASTGEPLKSATLKFATNGTTAKLKATNGNGEITKKTADKGGFMIKTLAEGSYQVVISKPGYKEQTVTVNVSDGEMSVLDIKLDKA